MPMDRSKYPPDWEEISRRIRFERAAGLCEYYLCKAPHGREIIRFGTTGVHWVLADDWESDCVGALSRIGLNILQALSLGISPRVKVVLTVAHLDHDTSHNDDDNLAAWCQLHHLRYDAERHAETMRRNKDLARQSLFPEDP